MSEYLHIMGISGSGASALAKLAKAFGYKVSGCDLASGGHSTSHLKGIDRLLVSPSVSGNDPLNKELVEAKRRRIPILTWQEFLGKYLMSNQKVVGVCGTHGKSTTTAMVAYILAKAGLDPTYLGGAKILGGENFHRGKGDYFVVESDEYNDNFLNYPLYLSACVSIEFDHPSYFKNFNHYLSSFEKFVRQGKVFVGYIGDLGVQKLIKRLRGWERDISGFRKLYQWELLLPGRHSRINAQAAYLTAKELGVPDSEIRKALATFPGIERRLELVGVRHGRKIYSDYGHHPTEIKATIQALRELYPKEKVILIFQPHTFARIEALFWDFVSVFRALPVEELVITDVFNRRREEGKVSSKDLVQAVGLPQVDYLRKEKVPQLINGSDKDVVVLMGAGDIDQLAEKL